jgi:hypothetical protein
MKKILFVIASISSIIIFWINLRLYAENFSPTQEKEDIKQQLNFLESEIKGNASAEKMQEIFPEGFVFTNALYGLAWCELANSDKSNKELKQKALKEALFAYKEINSAKARSIFNDQLSPENGIFYVGWKNYLLSKILALDTTFDNYQFYKDNFVEQSNMIVDALNESNSPYLQSYEGQAWPGDMFVGMASLSNHDKLFSPKYNNVIIPWITKVKRKLDPIYKMVPHKVSAGTGRSIDGPRGSSISLILRMLPEINQEFSKEQFTLYKKNFVGTTFGLPSISEYPVGQEGRADIDSGPVIFGVGFSGTIVSFGTFAVNKDLEMAQNQYKTINAFGFGMASENDKKYAFGQIPIADAFIAWGRASVLNCKAKTKPNSPFWLKFHLLSFLFLGFVFLPFYYKYLLPKSEVKIEV